MLGNQDWYSPDIEVVIKDSHEDTGLCGQIGVVRGVTPGMCSVFLHEEERTVNIAADHLAPVVPSRGDKVKVILGDEDKEQTGQLLSIDSQEGVVKLDHSGHQGFGGIISLGQEKGSINLALNRGLSIISHNAK